MTARTPNNVKGKDGIRGTGRKQFVMCGESHRDRHFTHPPVLKFGRLVHYVPRARRWPQVVMLR